MMDILYKVEEQVQGTIRRFEMKEKRVLMLSVVCCFCSVRNIDE